MQDSASREALRAFFEKIAATSGVIPVAHYSFEGNSATLEDFNDLKNGFPHLAHVAVNDVGPNFKDALGYAAAHFSLIIPLSEETLFLLDDPDFKTLANTSGSSVLIDNSRGTGQEVSVDTLGAMIEACLQRGFNKLALAGGFGPGMLERYFALCDRFGMRFSIDAESHLQTEGVLDQHKAVAYLEELLRHAHPLKKDAYVQETRSLAAHSRAMTHKEVLPYLDKELVVYPEVFHPGIFFSSQWYAQQVAELVAETKSFCEIGCGTGIVTMTVALQNPNLACMALDISKAAIENTQENTAAWGLAARVEVVQSDVLSALPAEKKLDTIFWALPFGYLEPTEELDTVDQQTFDPGYASIEKFFKDGKEHLDDAGRLLFGFSEEIGTFELIEHFAKTYGYSLKLLAEHRGIEKSPVSAQIYEAAPN
jgi:methylase of polypeptide subunit release factors